MAKKEHNKGKHVASQVKSKKHSNLSWIAIIVILIIIAGGILIYIFKDSVLNVFATLPETQIDNPLNENIHQELVNNESTVKKVENLDVLEVESFNIEPITPTQTKISIILKNASSEDVSDFTLDLYLIDQDENQLAKFKAHINLITPNTTKEITINTETDLTLVTDLLVSKHE